MGADLIINSFAIKQELNNDKGHKQIMEKMINKINKLNVKDYDECEGIIEDMFDIDKMDEEIQEEKEEEKDLRKKIINKLEENDKEILIEKSKVIFKKVVKETFEAIDGYRDVSWIQHKGDTIFITGGMSWGDSPTESYGVFEKFNNLPNKVLKAGGIR